MCSITLKISFGFYLGDIYILVLSDKTGNIRCTLFDQRASFVKEGDIILLTKAYAKEFQQQLTLYKGSNGEIWRTGDFMMEFNTENDMSKKIDREPETNNKISDDNASTPSRTYPYIDHRKKDNALDRDNAQGKFVGSSPKQTISEKGNTWNRERPASAAISWSSSSSSSSNASSWKQGEGERIPIKQRLGALPTQPFGQNFVPNHKLSQLKQRILANSHRRQNLLFRKSLQHLKVKSKRFS